MSSELEPSRSTDPQIRYVWNFKSSSGNGSYRTLAYFDGSLSCNCPGWTRRNPATGRTCKHVRQAQAWLDKNRSYLNPVASKPSAETDPKKDDFYDWSMKVKAEARKCLIDRKQRKIEQEIARREEDQRKFEVNWPSPSLETNLELIRKLRREAQRWERLEEVEELSRSEMNLKRQIAERDAIPNRPAPKPEPPKKKGIRHFDFDLE